LIGFKELVSGFSELGLARGDAVLVYSSSKSFGGVEEGPQTVVNALLEVLDAKGTLVMPTFTPSFCEQYNKTGKGYFDRLNTSQMGILTEMVRKMPEPKRSVNSIYSVAVFRRLAESLSSRSDKNVFSRESIFGKLYDLDGKNDN
jgi:aminoglycoside 3-N-acetyltransferase